MIPPFENNGYLPVGIYEATPTQIKNRYAYTFIRRRLFDGLERLVQILSAAGCKTLYLDGSYITSKKEPRDYDAVREFEGVDNTIDPLLRDELDKKSIKRKYGGDVFCRIPGCFDYVVYFQSDWRGIPKGIIKVDLEKLHGKAHNQE